MRIFQVVLVQAHPGQGGQRGPGDARRLGACSHPDGGQPRDDLLRLP